ncbi:MAG: peptide deformylase [Arsenophonus endosymbiont of Ceratovacuna japonica]
MSILNILLYPDKRLRKISKPVKKIDIEIQRIVNDMFDTMYKKEGIGLAAIQVNINKRIIVIDISETKNKKLVLINPIILETFGQTGIEEGCLSIPKQLVFVHRAQWIKIKALDINNKEFKLETNDLLSICIQHEIDHLNGKLFIDYLSMSKHQRLNIK